MNIWNHSTAQAKVQFYIIRWLGFTCFSLTSNNGVLMSMCSKTVNSFLVFIGRSHDLWSSAFTQYRTLPCLPSKDVAKGLEGDVKKWCQRFSQYIIHVYNQAGELLTSGAVRGWRETRVALSEERWSPRHSCHHLKQRRIKLDIAIYHTGNIPQES